MIAYLISHNGIGDNLYMIGALNFIKQFYENVYFLCKKKNYDNVKLFFNKSSNIICLPFDCSNRHNRYNEIKKILNDEKYSNNNIDIFICGHHKSKLQSKIKNKNLLNYKIIDKKYTLDWDYIDTNLYEFINNFYKDINLNLTYFYEYYHLPTTNKSKQLFTSISNYYLIFIQYKCSNGITLNVSNLIEKHINNDNSILICNDKNMYPNDHKKYTLAQKFVYNKNEIKIVDYLDTIKNSDEIYLIDSCFVGIVLPLLKTNKLKTKKVKIIIRSDVDKYIL